MTAPAEQELEGDLSSPVNRVYQLERELKLQSDRAEAADRERDGWKRNFQVQLEEAHRNMHRAEELRWALKHIYDLGMHSGAEFQHAWEIARTALHGGEHGDG